MPKAGYARMAFKWNQNVYSVEVMWINENE